jgi:hypothetical protein
MGLRVQAAELLCRVCPLGRPALRNLAYSESSEKASAATEYGRDAWQKQAMMTVQHAKRVGDACSGYFGMGGAGGDGGTGGDSISAEPLSPSLVAPPTPKIANEPQSPIPGIGGLKAKIGGAGSAFQPSTSTTTASTSMNLPPGSPITLGGAGSPVGFSLGGTDGVGYNGVGTAIGVGGDGGSGAAYAFAAKRYRGLAIPSIGSMWEDEAVQQHTHGHTGHHGTGCMESTSVDQRAISDAPPGVLGSLDFLTRLFTASLDSIGNMNMGNGCTAAAGTGALDLSLLITLRIARDANARQLMLGSPSLVVGLLGVTANSSLLPRHRKNACAALQWLSVTQEGKDAIVAITDALVTEYGRHHHNPSARARFGASPSVVSRSVRSGAGTSNTVQSNTGGATSVASMGSTCTSPTSSIGTGSPTFMPSPSPFPSEGGHHNDYDDGSDDEGMDDDRDGFARHSPTMFGPGGRRSPNQPGSGSGSGRSGAVGGGAPFVQRRIADDIPLALIDDVLDLMHMIPPHPEAEVLERMKREAGKATADGTTSDAAAPPAATTMNMSLGSGKQAFSRMQQKMACAMVLEALQVMLLNAHDASLTHYAAVCLCHTACDKGARQRLSKLCALTGRLGEMVEDGLAIASEYEEHYEAREMLIARWREWRQQRLQEQRTAAAEEKRKNKGKKGGAGGGGGAGARERTATSGSVAEDANGGARERTFTSGSATSEWSSSSEYANSDDPLIRWLQQWGEEREPPSLEVTQDVEDALTSCHLAANVLLNLSHDKPAQAHIAKSVLLPLLLHILRLDSLPWPLALSTAHADGGHSRAALNSRANDSSSQGEGSWAKAQEGAGMQAIKDLRMAIQGIVANVYSNPKARTEFYKAEMRSTGEEMNSVKEQAEEMGKGFWEGRGLSAEEMVEKSGREGRAHAKIALEAGLRRTLKWSLWKEEGGADGRSGGKNAHLMPEENFEEEQDWQDTGTGEEVLDASGKAMEAEQEWIPRVRQEWTLQTQRQAKAQDEVSMMQLNATATTSARLPGSTAGMSLLSQSTGALGGDGSNNSLSLSDASSSVLLSSLPKGVLLHNPTAPKVSGGQLKGTLYSLKSEWSTWGKGQPETETEEDWGNSQKSEGKFKKTKRGGKNARKGSKKLKKAKSQKGTSIAGSTAGSPVSSGSRKLLGGTGNTSAGGDMVADLDGLHKMRLRKAVDATLLKSSFISGTFVLTLQTCSHSALSNVFSLCSL